MAQFQPGHLHIERHALTKDDHSYNLCIDYEVAQDPKEGKGMQFRMHGNIQGKDMDETFFLAKDQAFDFARHVTRVAEKYGIPKNASSLGSSHKYYDLMFEDVRAQLDVKSGDPIKPEHLG
ncbi:DUF5064 family protein [Pseudomonas guariconensis]|uniref:DUF5064 family protein n=1 Tax=Pseudomonas TaxID=286 RepID=UPI001CE498E3|nr:MULTISPECIES: DUF5064 family protein [Pseudomonas]MCO7638024.1 DUF5064 family protein [Pseudomonas sp. S 311-6]MCO7517875.1 DUF5064 family protein [Pseudomonas putida]MCO7566280.1 DUF5064 family protein [Pseudomonas mosselii]MCO7592987.1 DUF5064 family protein [Pseudomonas guariconensis]MCO7608388.1 DUF5064 family protein [Pseudomonas guariconensis]